MVIILIIALLFVGFCAINTAIGNNNMNKRYRTTRRGNASRKYRISKTSKRWK